MAERVDPYRSPAEREPPTIIDHRPVSPFWLLGASALMVLLMVLTSHRVSLSCQRTADGSGYCQSADEHAFWRSEGERIDTSGLTGAKLVRGSKGASRVVLVAQSSIIELTQTSDSQSLEEKNALIDAFRAFLADRSAPRFEAAYGSRWASNLAPILFFVLPLAAFFALVTQRVRVIVDGAARKLHVHRGRFPLAASEETYELDQVQGAEVEAATGGRGGTTYRVALVLVEGRTRVPLTSGYTSGRARKDRAVAEIREALRLYAR